MFRSLGKFLEERLFVVVFSHEGEREFMVECKSNVPLSSLRFIYPDASLMSNTKECLLTFPYPDLNSLHA